MVVPILYDLLVIFGVSMVVVSLFHFLKQPPISGFIISGALIGPKALGWVKDPEMTQLLSEIGVVFLLFSLGIEFSFRSVMRLKKAFFLLGGLSSFVTAGLVTVAAIFCGMSLGKSVLMGALASLSSTAVVLKLLQDRRETATVHGNLAIAVLLFQDLLAVPLMLLLPVMAQEELQISIPGWDLVARVLLRIAMVSGGLFVGARYVVPYVLRHLAKTQIRELLLIGVTVLSLGSAWLSHEIGLSMALGAFVAGMLISESEYGTQAISDVIPFRDVFIAVFFVSIGMFLDFSFLRTNGLVILGLSAAILTIKFVAIATIASLLDYESRISALVALMLAQIGEFSFVLALKAHSDKFLSDTEFQYFLSVSIVVLLVTPLMIRWAPQMAPKIAALDFLKKFRNASPRIDSPPIGELRKDHVVIIGFGLNGQNLARALGANDIPFEVIEINTDTVAHWKQKGLPMVFGDASKREVLVHAGILRAKMVVVAISDSLWVKNVVSGIRAVRPDISILVRCQYLRDVDNLKNSSVTDLVVAEVETASEIFARVLFHYGIPATSITALQSEIEEESYARIRDLVGSVRQD
jgi:monovalent cation:H+ antiporter-2, CPA2 family